MYMAGFSLYYIHMCTYICIYDIFHTRTLMFIAPLFTVIKTQKQPKCPLTDKCIKKIQCIYTVEYYSAINETMLYAATWLALEMIILSEVSQKEKDKYHVISLTRGI